MKHFLFGIVFGELIFPIFSDVTAFISSGLEVFTTSFQKKSMENGLKIAKLKKEIEDTVGLNKDKETTQVIGFAIDSDDDEEEEI